MGSRIGVLPGPRTAFLDHLIPLCRMLDMPLVCTDSWVYAAAQIFYPETELIFAPDNLEEVLEQYETLYSLEPSRLHPKAFQFGSMLYRGEKRSVCGLHGNSDKNRGAFWAERYAHEDVVLVYGNYMLDFFKEKGVKLKEVAVTGNYRYDFYQKHKAFFDGKVPEFDSKKKRVLYAPTWSYPAAKGPNDSPFFEQLPEILNGVPDDYQLIVKLHPFMFRLFPEKIEELKDGRAIFLDETPLIYPLLDQIDIYLGDYSSVGYDFLAMDRPLFFLTDGPIVQTGQRVEDITRLYSEMDRPLNRSGQRKQMYDYVFGERCEALAF